MDALRDLQASDSLLDTTVTPDTWARRRPNDKLEAYRTDERDEAEDYCMRARTLVPGVAGRTVQRDVFFDVPDPAPGYVLPPDANAGALVRTACTMRAIRWRLPIRDSTTRELMQVVFVPITVATLGLKEPRCEQASWASTACWRHGRGVVELAVGATTAESESTGEQYVDLWLRPASRTREYQRDEDAGPAWDVAAIRLASAELRLERAEIERLLRAIKDGDSLVDPVVWRDRARKGTPAQRAAAFIITDLVLPGAIGWMDDSASTAEAQSLVRLGFNYKSIENGVWFYQHDLLDSALALVPRSEMAGAARAWMFTKYLTFRSRCAGIYAYENVAEDGRRALAIPPDTITRPYIQRVTADALASIYLDAQPAPPHENGEWWFRDQRTGPLTPIARREAIALYRAAFARGGPGVRIPGSWDRAWRLVVGLAPASVAYSCSLE